MAHPASLSIEQLLADCQIRRQRRSGPGGQHRNKVETGIFIEHLPSGLRAESTERRSQAGNQTQAVFRLRLQLAVHLRQPGLSERDHWQPSPLWRSRLRNGKIEINPQHDDFPALLAECLDALACYHWAPSQANEDLECSASQLVKLVKKEPRALMYVNQQRENSGLGPLR